MADKLTNEDRIKSRRGKRGPYGIDWYKYRNGVPPPDDGEDYTWNEAAQEWQKDLD